MFLNLRKSIKVSLLWICHNGCKNHMVLALC